MKLTRCGWTSTNVWDILNKTKSSLITCLNCIWERIVSDIVGTIGFSSAVLTSIT